MTKGSQLLASVPSGALSVKEPLTRVIPAPSSGFHVDLHQALCRLQGESEADDAPISREDPNPVEDEDGDALFEVAGQIDPSSVISPSLLRSADGNPAADTRQVSSGRIKAQTAGTKRLLSPVSVSIPTGGEKAAVREGNHSPQPIRLKASKATAQSRLAPDALSDSGFVSAMPRPGRVYSGTTRFIRNGARMKVGSPGSSVSFASSRVVRPLSDPAVPAADFAPGSKAESSARSVRFTSRTDLGGPLRGRGTRVHAATTGVSNRAGMTIASHAGRSGVSVVFGLAAMPLPEAAPVGALSSVGESAVPFAPLFLAASENPADAAVAPAVNEARPNGVSAVWDEQAWSPAEAEIASPAAPSINPALTPSAGPGSVFSAEGSSLDQTSLSVGTPVANPAGFEATAFVDDLPLDAAAISLTASRGSVSVASVPGSIRTAPSSGLEAAVHTGHGPIGVASGLPSSRQVQNPATAAGLTNRSDPQPDMASVASTTSAPDPTDVESVVHVSQAPVHTVSAPSNMSHFVLSVAGKRIAEEEADERPDVPVVRGASSSTESVRQAPARSASFDVAGRGSGSANIGATPYDSWPVPEGSATEHEISAGPWSSGIESLRRVGEDPAASGHRAFEAAPVLDLGERRREGQVPVSFDRTEISGVATAGVAESDSLSVRTATPLDAKTPMSAGEAFTRASERAVISDRLEFGIADEQVSDGAAERTANRKDPGVGSRKWAQDVGRVSEDEQPVIRMTAEWSVRDASDLQPRIVVRHERAQASPRWVSELVQEIEAKLARSDDGRAVVHIRVEPESLGEVHLEVVLNDDGQLRARFVTESSQAKELIESGFPQLQRRLQSGKSEVSGVVLEAVVQKNGPSHHEPQMAQTLSQQASYSQGERSGEQSQNSQHGSGYVPITGGGSLQPRRMETSTRLYPSGPSHAAVDLRA